MTTEPANDAAVSTDDGPTRSVARNIGALMSSQLVTWSLATALVWLVPRMLGAEAFGQLTLATSIWAIAVVFASFGTATMMTVEVAKRRQTSRSLLGNVIRLRLVLFAVATPVVALVMVVGPYDRSTIEVVALVGVGAALTLISTTYESGLHGLQEMGHTARVQVIVKVTLTVGTLAVLLLGGRLLIVATVAIASIALGGLLFFRSFTTVAPAGGQTTHLVGRVLVISAAPFLLAEATRVVYQQIDIVVMSLLVDRDAIGFYAAADTLFGSLLFVPVIVMTAMFPAIADLHHRAPDEVPMLLRRSFNTMLLVSVPIGLGTIVVSSSFVRLLFSGEFDDSAAVLAVFGVVVILSSQTILLGRFALATGRVRFWSALMVIVTILSVPLDIILVPWADRTFDNAAIGGALAYVVTESLLIIVGLLTIGRSVFSRSTAARVVRCAIAGAAMVAASWPLRDRMFVIPGTVAVAVYVLVILLLRTLDADERSMVKRAGSMVRKG